MAKILIVVGSQRANGFQAQLANEFKKTIGDRAEVDFFDYSEVPFVNQDIEFPAPASVATAPHPLTTPLTTCSQTPCAWLSSSAWMFSRSHCSVTTSPLSGLPASSL